MGKPGVVVRCKGPNRIEETLVQTSTLGVPVICLFVLGTLGIVLLQETISSSLVAFTQMATQGSLRGMRLSVVQVADGRGNEAGDVIMAEACRPLDVAVAFKGGTSSRLEAIPGNRWEAKTVCSISSLVAVVTDKVQVRRKCLSAQKRRRMPWHMCLTIRSISRLRSWLLNRQQRRKMCSKQVQMVVNKDRVLEQKQLTSLTKLL